MKSNFWVAITAALISSIANAQQTNVESQPNGESSMQKYLVKVKSDGTAILINQNGQELVLPKNVLELIRKTELSQVPTFEANNPCMSTAK